MASPCFGLRGQVLYLTPNMYRRAAGMVLLAAWCLVATASAFGGQQQQPRGASVPPSLSSVTGTGTAYHAAARAVSMHDAPELAAMSSDEDFVKLRTQLRSTNGSELYQKCVGRRACPSFGARCELL